MCALLRGVIFRVLRIRLVLYDVISSQFRFVVVIVICYLLCSYFRLLLHCDIKYVLRCACFCVLLYILCSDYRFLVRVDIIIVCSDLCVFLMLVYLLCSNLCVFQCAGIYFVFKFVRVSVCWYTLLYFSFCTT